MHLGLLKATYAAEFEKNKTQVILTNRPMEKPLEQYTCFLASMVEYENSSNEWKFNIKHRPGTNI